MHPRLGLLFVFAFTPFAPAQTASFTYYGKACGGGTESSCVTANTRGAVTGNFGRAANFALQANTGASARTLCGVELFCVLAQGTLANMNIWIYDATGAGGGPGNPLRTTTMPVIGQTKWHRADFAPLTLPAGTRFYVVFDNRVRLRLPQMRIGTNVTHYYNGPPTWLGPFTSSKWNYKVICCGTGTPVISNVGVPRINATFRLEVSSSQANRQALLAFGAVKTAIDLAVIGAPTCILHTDPLTVLPTRTNASGTASIAVNLPNDASLVGRIFLAQYAVSHPTANAAQLIFTAGAEGKVGR